MKNSLYENCDRAYTSLMSTSLKLSVVFLSLLLMASSCGASSRLPPSSFSSGNIGALELESGLDVIGHLEHRNGTVTVKSGAAGTILYSDKSKEGKILFENLTA